VDELQGKSVAVEKSLQHIIERHLETFLGVRFLASEHSTGKRHAGRIDTLGIDENNSPVISEYKKSARHHKFPNGTWHNSLIILPLTSAYQIEIQVQYYHR
jgi:hypothetical protein